MTDGPACGEVRAPVHRRLLDRPANGTVWDWQMKDDVQREMRRVIKKHLRAASFPIERLDSLAENIVDLLKRRRPSA
jgi:hypothetical protein